MKKFSDIFSIDSSTGGGKRLIKKVINKYGLGNEYKEIKENIENKGNSGGSDVNKKYGYYRISPDIFNFIDEGREQLYEIIIEMSHYSTNMELNGVTSFDRIGGIQGCINCPLPFVQMLLFGGSDSLPYCSKEYFKLGIMVDESDTNTSIISNNNKLDFIYKGTLLERFEEAGDTDSIQFFIPITKEEYENLSNDFKEQ